MFSTFVFTPSQQRGVLWLLLISSLTLAGQAYLRSQQEAQVPTISSNMVWQSYRLQLLDINLADSTEFDALPGIGPKTASRIIRYRNRKGGFASVDELAKVYGLSSVTLTEIRPFLAFHDSTAHLAGKLLTRQPQPKYSIPRLDLNLASAPELAKLPGIGKVLSQRIVNYRQAKNGFQAVHEVRKVYGLPDETYSTIIPYLYIGQVSHETLTPTREKTPETHTLLVELNSATVHALEQVPGIGPTLSTRIIAFRHTLGFFHDPSQLKAVYGLSEENFQRMQPHLHVEVPKHIQQKNLNLLSAYELSIFPSVSKAEAEQIVSQREKLGMFSDWSEFTNTLSLSPSTVAELQIYTQIF